MRNLNKSMRNINDERYTPRLLVTPILDFIKPNSIIWCPFDTEDSQFVQVFKRDGRFEVKYGHISTGQNFFTVSPPTCDYIISNPPFSQKLQVFERLYDLGIPWAMLMNIEILNYQIIGEFFYTIGKQLQLLVMDKKVSFDGNTSSFNTSYFCHNVLPNNLMFHHLPHNNTGKNFQQI